MKTLTAALWLALSPTLALAQTPATVPVPSLTVTGEGLANVPPDMAMVVLGVTTEGKTAAEALAGNNERQKAVLEALAAAGIAPRDVQTSGLNLNPIWDSRTYDGSGQPKITGYQASNLVTVRVRALDSLGGLLDDIVTTGANQLNSLSFGLADPKPASDEARRDAVADALARAQLLAGAAGVELGPILQITEGGSYQQPQPMFRREAAMDSAVPVAGGELGITATVTITFALGGQ